MAFDDEWTSVVGKENAMADRDAGMDLVAAWLAERGVGMETFDLADIRLDKWQVRSEQGGHTCVYAFWVRTSALKSAQGQ